MIQSDPLQVVIEGVPVMPCRITQPTPYSSAVVLQFVNAMTSHSILYEGILLTRTCAQEPRTSSQIYPFWLILLVPHTSRGMVSSTSSSDSSEANFEAVLLLYSHANSPSSCWAWHLARFPTPLGLTTTEIRSLKWPGWSELLQTTDLHCR